MPITLASQLREGTKKSHTMAENTGFVVCFLKGVVDKETYRNLLVDLYFIYSAMEEEIGKLTSGQHPVISLINFQELNRKESLESDLFFYYGNSWKEKLNPTKSAQVYVDRIKQIAIQSPELLVGHHYTRYIGDLSGGQILKRIAKKAMNLSSDEGLRFYNFDTINDEGEFKLKYREILDSLPINQVTGDLIIEEANLAFKFNMDIFKELEGNLISVIGKLFFQFLTRIKKKGSTE